MPDPTTNPAAAAPAAPTPATQPEALPQPGGKTRAPDGKFAAPTKPDVQPEPPRRLRLPTGEELDEHEAVARLTERQLDERALQSRLQRLKELEELEQRLKSDPRQALSREERRRLAVLEAQEWAAEQEEANLPPEQKALRQRERALQEREAKIRAEEERRAKEAEAAQNEQLRQEAVDTVKMALDLSGLPKTPDTARRLLAVMSAAVKRGVMYPPEVLARKLRGSYEESAQENFKALGGKGVLTRFPALVELLNGLEDADALKLLAPLGERLRRLNLESHGLAPTAPAAPDNLRQLPPQQPARQQEREDPWEVQKRIEQRARQRR